MSGAPALRPGLLALLGALSGLLSGMLGIGGGLVIGPALVLSGVPLKRAFGSALAVVLPVALIGVLTEVVVAPENLLWVTAAVVAVGGQAGALLAGRALPHLRERPLRLAFALLVLYAALRNLGILGAWPEEGFSGLAASTPPLAWLAAAVFGVLAGLCAVFFGVGGGVVVVPGLVFGVGGISLHQAMATSLLAMVPTAAQGVRVALRQQRIDPPTVTALMPTALLGAAAGVALRNLALEPKLLALIFGCFLLFVCVQLLRRTR